MPRITQVRPVLLSAPYGFPESLEVRTHLPAGLRTCGLVEIRLDDGTVGLGEGYLAVFAPRVFEQIVRLLEPYLVGREAHDITARYREMCSVADYWSMQGAARHAIAAVEIALYDAKARGLGLSAWSLLGGLARGEPIPIYGSGGDSPSPQWMARELSLLKENGIKLFKIRARNHEMAKAVWTIEKAAEAEIGVAIDMTQNLANPAQTVSEVVRFMREVSGRSSRPIAFLEEPLGPMDVENWKLLRGRVDTKVCGGETITTAADLCRRVREGCYDFSQPDATVIGGLGQTMEVFAAGRHAGVDTVVHCWGGAVGMMANYHAAFAGGGMLVEWPMPAFPIREAMIIEPLRMENGRLLPPRLPGLGVELTAEIERRFPFREEAVYQCLGRPPAYDANAWAL